MNNIIKELASKANFGHVVKTDSDIHYDPRLSVFAELILAECCRAMNPMLRDQISRGQAVELIKEHFRVE